MKISLITAVYEAEATIGEAIASVTSQSYSDLEHVVVEGNSPDGSLTIIKQLSHEKMHIISEPDDGIYDALNKGIRYASGDIIGFIHSDDFLAHKDVLARIVEAFEDPEVEAVFSDLDYVSQNDTSRIIRHWSTGPFLPKYLKYGWMPPHPTLYLRREVYERYGYYDTSFDISADYDYILRYFSQANGKSIYIPQVFYKMRLGGASNRSIAKIRQKMSEDLLAIQRNNIGGLYTLVLKNLSKINQFLIHK